MEPMHVKKGEGDQLHIPDFLEMTVLVSSQATDGTLCIMEDVVPPGIGPPRHIHHKQDEVFFVLEGSFKFEVAGQTLSASAGDIAVAPRGVVHAFKNVGESKGVLRYIFSPAGDAEAMFRAICESAKVVGLSHEMLAKAAEPFDQEIVGPPL
ncbi:cupin domain-containing protein [Fuerstiella marisgermanici]|uniref:Quercetin 2,3-dioxygenase n=1 Tax=Fuerstiella marisgermanici TaxID=1891926 RepID=A0A1P8WBY5_9PLAN|nr:cupin domain-containing protein [Fuerstiella marisgermanici]APZ91578.1 Quercetin 2,3-dioxygenase [Fuerstiella marisgermanici]